MNYIASKLDFELISRNNLRNQKTKIKVDDKIYTVDDNVDPQYRDDGVLDISYFELCDENGEYINNMIFAFEHVECNNPQEWSDEYKNPHVLVFK